MINIVVALMAEAKPIIDYFKLTAIDNSDAYKIYRRDDISLIISGVGKVNAAGACAYLYAQTGSLRQRAWLNIGIAGHQSLPVGQLLRVDQLFDEVTQQRFYPHSVIDDECLGETLVSVDRPEIDYHQSALYDMEGAGFFATANRFSTAELIGLYKIISDNQVENISELIYQQVGILIKQHITTIASIVSSFKKISCEQMKLNAMPKFYKEVLAYCHFSLTQKRELTSLLKKWELVNPSQSFSEVLKNFQSSDEIIDYLRKSIIDIPMEF